MLKEDYKNVISAIRKHKKITLDVLRSKLPGDTKRREDGVKILRRTIDGLNETLLEERIKNTELRKMIKGYKRDNLSLINDLRAHMAEVNYLTKIANGKAGDPSVVRKMAKLEKCNRELMAKYEKLRVILLVRKESRKMRRYKNRGTKQNLYSSWTDVSSMNSSFKTSKLSSSCEILVDIRPSKKQNSTYTSVALIPEFHWSWLVDNESINNGLSSMSWSRELHANVIFNVTEISDNSADDEKRKTDNNDKRLLSCLKNERSSSADYRKQPVSTTTVTVRFDPDVKCCLSDSIDSKIYCKKRAKFIQESAYNLLSNREIKVPLLMQYFVNLWGGGGMYSNL